MKIRKRISIDEDVYKAAVKYSKLDNRTFSQLMQEAVKRMMHRFPKKEVRGELDRVGFLEIAMSKMILDIDKIKRKIK